MKWCRRYRKRKELGHTPRRNTDGALERKIWLPVMRSTYILYYYHNISDGSICA